MTTFDHATRMRDRALSILLAAPLTVLLLTSCSSYGGSNNRSEPSVTCDDALATVVERIRADDTAGAINSEIDWLSHNCTTEYDVFADYASTKGSAEQFGPDTCDSLTQYIGREAIALLSEDGLCSDGTAGSPVDASTVENQPGGEIAWNEAVNYAGTTQHVCGPLAGSGNSNDDVFLNLGRDYPDTGRFQIVLWDIGGVEPIPHGTTLCTTGEITLYEGVAQIELKSASLVEIYE
ncbi:hypothetical protein SAMN05216282_105139 [Cryobacterium psychrotolerans]|uniref:Uncharacterized protein n=2 Tax=Cryobacterium psychrotolerans TaxID=386301 RepID=A0A1G9BCP3_9MICO|nr:hypothetical protein SAMN05216282_105139 [Cryobacterium psychrotolerans]